MSNRGKTGKPAAVHPVTVSSYEPPSKFRFNKRRPAPHRTRPDGPQMPAKAAITPSEKHDYDSTRITGDAEGFLPLLGLVSDVLTLDEYPNMNALFNDDHFSLPHEVSEVELAHEADKYLHEVRLQMVRMTNVVYRTSWRRSVIIRNVPEEAGEDTLALVVKLLHDGLHLTCADAEVVMAKRLTGPHEDANRPVQELLNPPLHTERGDEEAWAKENYAKIHGQCRDIRAILASEGMRFLVLTHKWKLHFSSLRYAMVYIDSELPSDMQRILASIDDIMNEARVYLGNTATEGKAEPGTSPKMKNSGSDST